jgi:tetratricopeptide (TPR) repeat protein
MRVRRNVICAAVAAAVAGSACGQLGVLRARKAYKDANVLYQAQNYREAANRYEEALSQCSPTPDGCTEPSLTPAYFFLANSYDNLYRPSRRGEPENDAYLTKAVENYKLSAEREATNPQIKQLAMEYLMSAYQSPDKVDDPSLAEPVVLKIIEMDPGNPLNYAALARIYEDGGELDKAEATLMKGKEVKPSDPAVYQQLAGYYQRQGEFGKLIEAVQQRAAIEPENPEAHYSIASFYWDEAYRNTRLTDAQKRDYTQKGLEAVEKAISLKNDYVEAIVYKGLLLRLQANAEKDRAKQLALIKEAEGLQEKAAALKKKQQAAGD